MSLLEKNDLLFAHLAINISSGLSANTRRVAGALLWHFNRKTGQCNPSIERLATMLKIHRATVLRATDELCSKEVAMFTKLSHGGKFHTASYTPQWNKFRSIVNEFNAEMKGEIPSPNVAELRPQQSQGCDFKGRRTATQTYRRNLLKEPIATVQVDGSAFNDQNSSQEEPQHGLGIKPNASTTKPSYRPKRIGNQATHEQAALAAAERRWFGELKRMDAVLFTQVLTILGDRPDVYEQATERELMKKGTGLQYVLDALSVEMQAPSLGVSRCHP